jgi:prephenate dehydrogenase
MQITLIGLDTLGLSLGLALKAVASEIQLVGHDRERGRIKAASQAGAIDKGHWNLLSACDGSDLVVVNESWAQAETELTVLARELSADVVALVLASVQRPIQALLAQLDPRATFIGGRFVARGLSPDAEPSAALLKDALFYVIAPPTAPAEAVHTVVSLGEAVGARACFADAAEHDGLAAPTEQLPRLLALSLLSTLSRSDGQRDLQRALAPAMGALAGYAPAPDDLAELFANRDNLARWVSSYAVALNEMALWLAGNSADQLAAEAVKVQQALALWGRAEENDNEQPDASPGWRQMLLGQRRPKRRA